MSKKVKWMPDEGREVLRLQENMYYNSGYLHSRWYRKVYGGKWRLLKFGRDTPNIRLFSTWSKMGDDCWSGQFTVIDIEEYPITNVTTNWMFIKRLFKNIFNK